MESKKDKACMCIGLMIYLRDELEDLPTDSFFSQDLKASTNTWIRKANTKLNRLYKDMDIDTKQLSVDLASAIEQSIKFLENDKV